MRLPKAIQDPRSVLVIPFADGIGDFVMMLPLLRFVQRRFPEAALTVAASQRSALLLSDDERRVTVRTPSWLASGPPQPRTPGPIGVGRLWPQAALAWLEGPLLRWQFGGAHSFGRSLNLHHWWEDGYDFDTHWTPQVPSRPGAVHALDYLATRLERELGMTLPVAERRPVLTLRAEAKSWAASWWREAGLTETSGSPPVVALVPASNMQLKRWPLSHWVRLADALTDAGCVPLLCLPPGEDPAETIATRCRRPVRVVRAPLDHMTALLAQCTLVVGVDTGLLHIAAAVGTRYVGLFGPTNPHVTGPYDRALGTTLVAPFPKQDSCRACWRQFKYVDDRCQTFSAKVTRSATSAGVTARSLVPEIANSCMVHLPVEDVLAASHVELRRD